MREPSSNTVRLTLPEGVAGLRLDRALAEVAPPGLSRSRLTQLIRDGAVMRDGRAVTDPRAKVKPGETYLVSPPPPEPAAPEAEAIPLAIVYEDAHLIVVAKPAGICTRMRSG